MGCASLVYIYVWSKIPLVSHFASHFGLKILLLQCSRGAWPKQFDYNGELPEQETEPRKIRPPSPPLAPKVLNLVFKSPGL